MSKAVLISIRPKWVEKIASQCINERYKAYNAYFYGRRKDGWDG